MFVSMSAAVLASFAQRGIEDLGHEVEAVQLLASSVLDFTSQVVVKAQRDLFEDARIEIGVWKKLGKQRAMRQLYEARTGEFGSSISLETILTSMEENVLPEIQRQASRPGLSPPVLFAAEIRTKRVERSPESLLARIWNECLGPRAIPFDPVAREALIADGCKHPELKRHIAAWQEMSCSRPDANGPG